MKHSIYMYFFAALAVLLITVSSCDEPNKQKKQQSPLKPPAENQQQQSPLEPLINNQFTAKKVAEITAKHGTSLKADKFANKGYTAVRFAKDHKVTTIEKGAFARNKVRELVIPDGTKKQPITIQENAFKGNPLTKLTLGKHVVAKLKSFATSEKELQVIVKGEPPSTPEDIASIFGRIDVKFQAHSDAKGIKEKEEAIVQANANAKKSKELKEVVFRLLHNQDADFATQYVTKDKAIKEPKEKPNRKEQTFAYWYHDKNTRYDFSQPITQDITLYAKWKASVTFKNGDAIVHRSLLDLDGKTKATPHTPEEKPTNIFDGWYTDEELTQKYDFNTVVTKNITLHAKWNEKPTIESVSFADEPDEPDSTIVYNTGDKIPINVIYKEPVVVDTTGGTPQIQIKLDRVRKRDIKRYAQYISGSGTTILRFEYSVQASDSPTEDVTIPDGPDKKIELEGGTIKNSSGIDAYLDYSYRITNSLTYRTVPATVPVKPEEEADVVPPTVFSVYFQDRGEKAYKKDDVISVVVRFSEAVVVDTSKGSPKIKLQIGSENKEALFNKSASSDKKLVFEYTVAEGDTEPTGITILGNTLDANGATIQDKAGNAATLTHSNYQDRYKLVNEKIDPELTFDQFPGLTDNTADAYLYYLKDNTAYVKVDAKADAKFTFKVSSALTGTTYRATHMLGERPANAFTLDSATGTITLQGNNKGGKYTITATRAETDVHKKASTSYTLYVMLDSPFTGLPDDGQDVKVSGEGTYKYKSTDNSFRTHGARNGDKFRVALGKNADDKGTITYESSKPFICSVDESGIVTVNDEVYLHLGWFFGPSEVLTITVKKAEWEYFKAANTKVFKVFDGKK